MSTFPIVDSRRRKRCHDDNSALPATQDKAEEKTQPQTYFELQSATQDEHLSIVYLTRLRIQQQQKQQ